MASSLTAAAPGNESTVHAGSWTALWISVAMTSMGAVLAFDVRGIATAIHKNNTEFTAWGRRLHTSEWPNAARVVGWFFLIPGVILLLLTVIVAVIHLFRKT